MKKLEKEPHFELMQTDKKRYNSLYYETKNKIINYKPA